MAWIKTKSIDGVDVVVGFGAPGVDPEETKKRVARDLEKSDEWKAADKLQKQVDDQLSNLVKSQESIVNQLKISRGRRTKHGGAQRNALHEKYKETTAEIERHKEQIADALDKVSKRAEELFRTRHVLLRGGGYREVDQSVWDDLRAKYTAMGPRRKLLPSGTVIDDLRKSNYLYKTNGRWESGRIEKLSDKLPATGKLAEQLTDDDKLEIMIQGKRDTIAEMDPQQRSRMLKDELDSAALHAAQLVIAYELQGRDDPKDDAKEWLTAEEKRIKEIYNVA